jgi:hypothetical protein
MTMKLLLIMQARPGLVSQGRKTRETAKKGHDKREFWSPNVIGADYRISRVAELEKGASPRTQFPPRGSPPPVVRQALVRARKPILDRGRAHRSRRVRFQALALIPRREP